MAFTLEPKAGPHTLSPTSTPVQETGQSARDRALAQLMGNQGHGQPAVPNQNKVSPEEMGAVKTRQDAAGQDGQIEPPTEATPEEAAPAKEPLSDKYAALARRERQLQNERQKLKAERDAFLAERSKPATPTFDESKYISRDRLEQDLLGTLNDSGYSYDKIVEQALNQQSMDPAVKSYLQRMEAQIKAKDEQFAKLQSSLEEQQNNQRKQAVNQIRSETASLVKNDPNFETIRETNSINDVVELIEKTFDEDGILLTVEEAAQAVEDHLLEEAMKLTKIGKIQQRLSAAQKANAAKVTPEGVQTTQASQPQQSKTLTNNMGTTRQLSARERAILAAKGELK